MRGEAEREDPVVERDDFWASTSNKQLNFLHSLHDHAKELCRANNIRGVAHAIPFVWCMQLSHPRKI